MTWYPDPNAPAPRLPASWPSARAHQHLDEAPRTRRTHFPSVRALLDEIERCEAVMEAHDPEPRCRRLLALLREDGSAATASLLHAACTLGDAPGTAYAAARDRLAHLEADLACARRIARGLEPYPPVAIAPREQPGPPGRKKKP